MQSSCLLLTVIISGCQHCWLWGFKIFCVPAQTSLYFQAFQCKQNTGCFALRGGLSITFLWKSFTDFYNLVCAFRHAASFPKYFVDLGSKHLDKDRDLAAQRAPHALDAICLSDPGVWPMLIVSWHLIDKSLIMRKLKIFKLIRVYWAW